MLSADGIRRGVECLLFVSSSPLKAREMALALEVDEKLVAQAAGELASRDAAVSGLRVEEVAGGWMMVTSPEYAVAVARFVGKRAQKLSRAALECLAIVAYNQPCTGPEVEDIRGVDSTGVMKSLVEKGLVRELGRKEGPGRPVLYGTTEEFLVYFGLRSLDELPDQSVLEQTASLRVQTSLPDPDACAVDSRGSQQDGQAVVPDASESAEPDGQAELQPV